MSNDVLLRKETWGLKSVFLGMENWFLQDETLKERPLDFRVALHSLGLSFSLSVVMIRKIDIRSRRIWSSI